MNARLLRKSPPHADASHADSSHVDASHADVQPAAMTQTRASAIPVTVSALVWIVVLLLGAAAVTIPQMDADPIWIDEYWSIYNAGGAHYGPLSPDQIFTRIASEDIWHVPLYYLLIAGWGQLAGWTPFALRLLSMLFGLLSVAMAYRMGRDLHSHTAGLGAAVAVGASAYLLYYFHELRCYTLNVLLGIMAVWSYWRAMHDARPRRMIAVFFLTALTILYTHYLNTIILAAIGLYHLIAIRRDRRWWMVTAAAALAVIFFLPWFGVTLRAWREASAPESIALRDWGPGALELNVVLLVAFGNGAAALPLLMFWLALREPADRYLRDLGRHWHTICSKLRNLEAKKPPIPGPFPHSTRFARSEGKGERQVALDQFPFPRNAKSQILPTGGRESMRRCGAASSMQGRGYSQRNWHTSPVIYGLILLVGALLVAFILNKLIALFVVLRYLLPLWGVLALLVGIGVAKAHERRTLAPAVLLGVWLFSGFWASQDATFMTPYLDQRLLSKTPWQTIQTRLATRGEADDTVLFLLPDETWYVWQDWVSDYYLHGIKQQGVQTRLVESYPYIPDRDYRRAARDITAARVWLGYFDAQGDKPLAWRTYAGTLSERYALCDKLLLSDDPRDEVYHLDLYSRIPAAPDYRFGGQVAVDLAEPLKPRDGLLNVLIGIAVGPDINPQAYSVGLYLLDAHGRRIAQRDFGVLAPGTAFAPYRCQQVTFDLSGLSAGDYTLAAVVYDWQTLERLPTTQGDQAILGHVAVE